MSDIIILKDNKLTGILSSFSPAEIKGFDHFLHSGLVPVNEEMQTLYAYLSSLYPVFSNDRLDKHIVFARCFGKKMYDDKKLRYLVTDLTRCCDAYVAFVSLQKQDGLKQTLLAKAYAERNCEKAYNGIVLLSRRQEEKPGLRDAAFYYLRFETEFTHMEYVTANSQRSEESNIAEVNARLDKFYLIKKLQLLCEVQNVKNVLSREHDVRLRDEILHHLEKHDYPDTPAIGIYHRILMTLTQSADNSHFKQLQKLLLNNGDSFSQPELRDMYQYVLNYCIKKINTGHTEYQRILFEIYKIMLEKNVLLVKNKLSQWDYKNVVTISLRLAEFNWCYKFINGYKDRIAAKDRENAYNYNIAFWYFYKKEYSKTLHLLQQVNFTDLYYQLDSRVIILKIYVEQEEDESLFYHLSAFRTFLNRNKLVSDYQRLTYKNLIKYTTRLVRAAGNKKKLAELKKEVLENKQIADLQWLLRKIEE